jgi:SPASM domain peptide maturase of grasp-with-spasm system
MKEIVKRKEFNEVKNLDSEKYGFFSNDMDLIQEVNLSYNEPRKINNIIIDWGEFSKYNFINALKKSIIINPQFILLRYNNSDVKELNFFLDIIKYSGVRNLQIHIDRSKINASTLKKIRNEFRFGQIVIFSSKKEIVLKTIFNQVFIFISKKFDLKDHCCSIKPNHFNSTLSFVTESLQYNNCLNKKLTISEQGIIKNCPFDSNTFGEIDDFDLDKILSNKKFTEKWTISKNQVDVCKDCEYRLICSDCRLFTTENNKYGKPKYCNYNPYTGVWGN